jgi:dTMP kinase
MTAGMKMYGKHRFPGKLFVVEGIDGSGKSTQIALLQKWLESEGYVAFFSEWNSSPLVREVTRRGKKKRMLTPMTFSLIHATDFADRTEHHIVPPL